MFFQKSIREVTLEDLNRLAVSGTTENLQLDFKEELPNLGSDKGKRELVKDITAFANTSGGTILYGVGEDKENGSAIVKGIDCSDVDRLKRHISSIIQGNTDPALVRYEIEAIKVSEGSYVIGIDVPKSWNAPHAVKVKKDTYRFYIRVNTENVPMDIPQIRDHIIANQALAEKIRGFVTERLMSLSVNDTPIQLYQTTKLVLHLVPVDALIQNKHVKLIRDLPPLDRMGYNDRYNLEGILTYNENYGSYTQLYRNGIVEAVAVRIFDEVDKKIYAQDMLRILIRGLGEYLSSYKKMNIQCPIYGFISLQGVKYFSIPKDLPHNTYDHFERDIIQLPEMVIEDLDSDPIELLRFPMDVLWNAGGLPGCNELNKFKS